MCGSGGGSGTGDSGGTGGGGDVCVCMNVHVLVCVLWRCMHLIPEEGAISPGTAVTGGVLGTEFKSSARSADLVRPGQLRHLSCPTLLM